MMNKNISTLADLHLEKRRLKNEYHMKGVQLKEDTVTYVKSVPQLLIKNLFTPQKLMKIDEKANITGSIMSMLLPLVVNKTVFRGSGFITKSIAALVSKKVGKSLDAENLVGIFSSIKSLFGAKKHKKEVKFVDYGIPPDSETY